VGEPAVRSRQRDITPICPAHPIVVIFEYIRFPLLPPRGISR
jgi:hypothetical protein